MSMYLDDKMGVTRTEEDLDNRDENDDEEDRDEYRYDGDERPQIQSIDIFTDMM